MSGWILSILLLWTCFEGFYRETQRCVHTVLTTTSSSTAPFQKRVSLLLICQYYSFQSPKKPSFFHCLGFCPQPYLKPRLPFAKVHTAKYVAQSSAKWKKFPFCPLRTKDCPQDKVSDMKSDGIFNHLQESSQYGGSQVRKKRKGEENTEKWHIPRLQTA